eukprot:CAMPEP_0202411302 /NCGR_PEP_ID=MMETSP1128-20130828/21493_1 /ASSEMBLY_ACC=CAM_ASM_000463 /TAXON_ID=3047 /ORGANISM="Dunaliella tertiolecta, Strain CCMP1320" /LENGTH=153 /DNA_ID=CAMNT_0049016965 /DNA_START=69 /DNA_END=527 /DNA_ORIENTATION=-
MPMRKPFDLRLAASSKVRSSTSSSTPSSCAPAACAKPLGLLEEGVGVIAASGTDKPAPLPAPVRRLPGLVVCCGTLPSSALRFCRPAPPSPPPSRRSISSGFVPDTAKPRALSVSLSALTVMPCKALSRSGSAALALRLERACAFGALSSVFL